MDGMFHEQPNVSFDSTGEGLAPELREANLWNAIAVDVRDVEL